MPPCEKVRIRAGADGPCSDSPEGGRCVLWRGTLSAACPLTTVDDGEGPCLCVANRRTPLPGHPLRPLSCGLRTRASDRLKGREVGDARAHSKRTADRRRTGRGALRGSGGHAQARSADRDAQPSPAWVALTVNRGRSSRAQAAGAVMHRADEGTRCVSDSSLRGKHRTMLMHVQHRVVPPSTVCSRPVFSPSFGTGFTLR